MKSRLRREAQVSGFFFRIFTFFFFFLIVRVKGFLIKPNPIKTRFDLKKKKKTRPDILLHKRGEKT